MFIVGWCSRFGRHAADAGESPGVFRSRESFIFSNTNRKRCNVWLHQLPVSVFLIPGVRVCFLGITGGKGLPGSPCVLRYVIAGGKGLPGSPTPRATLDLPSPFPGRFARHATGNTASARRHAGPPVASPHTVRLREHQPLSSTLVVAPSTPTADRPRRGASCRTATYVRSPRAAPCGLALALP